MSALAGEGFPSASVTALKGKVSCNQEPKNTTKPYLTTDLTQDLLGGENPGRWLPLLVRSSRELGRMQDLCRGSGESSLGLEGLCGLILVAALAGYS